MNDKINQPAAEPMGRPPIHDTPMTSAERQRRRRQRLRREPWNDPRSLAWAVVAALRGLRAEDIAAIPDTTLAALIDRAAEELAPETEQAEAAVAALTRFLDHEQPLPERRGHRGGRGHRFGDRHRRRREARNEGRRAADED